MGLVLSKGLKVGEAAPDFSLPSMDGRIVALKDFVGKRNLVLYFYPKDNTPGCTKEACGFRDSYEVFSEMGAEVVGVSSDSSESHRAFAARNGIPFLLLSDENNEVRKRYRVPASFGVIPGRVTFIIDRQGAIRHVFSSQIHPERHIQEAVKILKELR